MKKKQKKKQSDGNCIPYQQPDTYNMLLQCKYEYADMVLDCWNVNRLVL